MDNHGGPLAKPQTEAATLDSNRQIDINAVPFPLSASIRVDAWPIMEVESVRHAKR